MRAEKQERRRLERTLATRSVAGAPKQRDGSAGAMCCAAPGVRLAYAGGVLFVFLAGVAFLLPRPWVGILSMRPRRPRDEVAEATIWEVVVLDRRRFGTATVRIVYLIRARDGSSLYAIRETRMKVSQLPRAGQQVSVRFDPRDHQSFEVLSTAGTETYGSKTPRS